MALMPILSVPLQRRRPALVRLAVIADAMREYPLQPGLLLRRPGHAGGIAAVPQRLRDRLQRALEDIALDRLPRHHARAGKQREGHGTGARRPGVQDAVPHGWPGGDDDATGIDAAVGE